MDNLGNNSNVNKRILVSRNHPSAFVVGGGNFVAAEVIKKLLESKTQVLAFDQMDRETRDNLAEAFRYNHFYFFGTDEGLSGEVLDRIDGEMSDSCYGFFFCNPWTSSADLKGFINLAAKFQNPKNDLGSTKVKCVFVSNIGLYKNKLDEELKKVKSLEVMFAKGMSDRKINGRVVRLAAVYGPKMTFDRRDPMCLMIEASLTDKLRDGGVSDEFSTRAIFVDRAVDLIIKSVLTGSTAMKIYDGALVHPLKVTELRQVLMDIDWSIQNKVEISKLSPWLTPNLEKTVRELNWSPEGEVLKDMKKTIEYFRKNPERIGSQKVESVKRQEGKAGKVESVMNAGTKSFWDDGQESVKPFGSAQGERQASSVKKEELNEETELDAKTGRGWGKWLGYLVLIMLVGFGLVYPMATFGIGVFRIGWNLSQTEKNLSEGEFKESVRSANAAAEGVGGIKKGFSPVDFMGKMGIFRVEVESVNRLIETIDDGVVAIRDASVGFEELSKVSSVISGENTADPATIYSDANVSLRSSRESLSKVALELKNIQLSGAVGLFRPQIERLQAMVMQYLLAVGKGEIATMVLPNMTGVGGGSRSYLVILQNNKNLRPSGGSIEALAKIDFNNGKIANVESKSSDELDEMTTPLAAPVDIHNDLGVVNWSIRDSSYDPDFAAFSRVVQLLYQRDTGTKVDGVVGVDYSAFNQIIAALKGVDTKNGVRVDGKVIGKEFFDKVSGNQVISNLLSETLNKMFFLDKVNWSELGTVIDEGLRFKDIQLFVDEKSSFAYIASQNWGGVMLRQPAIVVGEERDFLSVNDVVIATGSANIELSKKLNIQAMIGEDLGVSHKLKVEYLVKNINGQVSSIKSRARIYVPGGNKLDRVTIGGVDVTANFKTTSDFGRIVFSGLINLPIDQPTVMEVGYSSGVIRTENKELNYRLDIVKQAGSGESEVEWLLSFPESWKVTFLPPRALSSKSAVSMSDSLNADLTISVTVTKP